MGFVGLNINVHDNHNTTGSNFRIIIRETVPYFNVHANFIYGYYYTCYIIKNTKQVIVTKMLIANIPVKHQQLIWLGLLQKEYQFYLH